MSSKASKGEKKSKSKSSSSSKKSKKSSSGKKERSRKKKDKDAPKRGLSAYILFSQDQRNQLKESQPDLKFGEVAKVLAAKWKKVSDDERKKYEARALKDKQRYEKEIAAYKASKGDSGKKSSKSKSKSKGKSRDDG